MTVQYSAGVGETAAAPGLGNVTGTGAISSHFALLSAAYANGDNFCYCIRDQTGPKWEIGIGKWTTNDIVIREFVLASSESNSGPANFNTPVYIVGIGPQVVTVAAGAALF